MATEQELRLAAARESWSALALIPQIGMSAVVVEEARAVQQAMGRPGSVNGPVIRDRVPALLTRALPEARQRDTAGNTDITRQKARLFVAAQSRALQAIRVAAAQWALDIDEGAAAQPPASQPPATQPPGQRPPPGGSRPPAGGGGSGGGRPASPPAGGGASVPPPGGNPLVLLPGGGGDDVPWGKVLGGVVMLGGLGTALYLWLKRKKKAKRGD